MAFQGDSIYWVEVEKVVPNPFQPRREFDQNKLQELADSIRMYGVLQPLTVTRNEIQQDNGTFYTEYELIAGERRLRASKLAGVAQVPVIIREGEQSEQEKLELAIIENLQREDLNAVDRAIAFRQLADVFGLSHALVAQKVGRSREYVSNTIRLLALPEHMLTSLKHGNMTEGHARTLLMLTDRPEEQEVIYKEILLKKLSVREVERIVRKIATDKVRKKTLGEFDAHLIEFEKQFTETLGTRVQIQKTEFGGKLTIDYFSEDDLEAMLKRMRDDVGHENTMQSESEMVEKIVENTPLEITEVSAAYSDSQQPVQENRFIDMQVSEPTTAPESVYMAHNSTESHVSTSVPSELPVPQFDPQLEQTPEQTFEQVVKSSPWTPAPAPMSVPTPILEVPPVYSPIQSNNYQVLSNQPSEVPPSQQVVVPEPQAVVQPVQNKVENDDESGLYSIRNFSV